MLSSVLSLKPNLITKTTYEPPLSFTNIAYDNVTCSMMLTKQLLCSSTR